MAAHFWYPDNRISPDSDDAFTQEEIEEIIGLVRESSFLDDESGLSIDERMTEVFGGEAPEWSGFQTTEGFCCVNCGGVMSSGGENMGVVIQFEIADDLESFVFSGMLIDGVEQPEGLILQFEEQFATNMWDEYDEDDDSLFSEDEGYNPRSRFAASGYGEWENSALWDDEGFAFDDEDDDEDEFCEENHHGHDCGCGHHHHHHESFVEEEIIFSRNDDEEDDDDTADWGDDAAERFWYGSDDEY